MSDRANPSREYECIPCFFRYTQFMTLNLPLACLCLQLVAATTSAAIIGTNPPALPLAFERIEIAPPPQRSAWKRYLENSIRQLQADQDSFRTELLKHHITRTIIPPEAHGVRGIPLNNTADWYAQPEALRISDIILSFQTPAGGWSKNLDMTSHRRQPGERFSTDNTSRFPILSDNDAPTDQAWNYVGTFDNDATITQLRYLAKVISAIGPERGKPYQTAFLLGLDYIFAAQYPNGGWPQVWPLQGGYHDAITYNDNAMIQVIELLQDVVGGKNEFQFVPAKLRVRVAVSVKRGIQCILASQWPPHSLVPAT